MKAKPSLSTLSLFTKSAVAVIFALIFGAAAFAQIDRAELEGTVTDPSGAAVARPRHRPLLGDSFEQRL